MASVFTGCCSFFNQAIGSRNIGKTWRIHVVGKDFLRAFFMSTCLEICLSNSIKSMYARQHLLKKIIISRRSVACVWHSNKKSMYQKAHPQSEDRSSILRMGCFFLKKLRFRKIHIFRYHFLTSLYWNLLEICVGKPKLGAFERYASMFFKFDEDIKQITMTIRISGTEKVSL